MQATQDHIAPPTKRKETKSNANQWRQNKTQQEQEQEQEENINKKLTKNEQVWKGSRKGGAAEREVAINKQTNSNLKLKK